MGYQAFEYSCSKSICELSSNHIEKTYKRPLNERLIRSLLSIVLSKSINFRIEIKEIQTKKR